ncbi:MAG: DUF2784 domain-containing protein [Spirochaetes bacterium]|nr:MAG: DUF2784 domain-containing protein [Spirochaetota bacterium]
MILKHPRLYTIIEFMNFYALAADSMVFLHLLYVSFTVGGTFLILLGAILKWHWVRNRVFRLIHTIAVLIVTVESLIGVWCPLTVWEWKLRALAGQNVENDISFVGRLIRDLIFVNLPSWAFTLMYVGFGLLVLVILIFVKPEKRKIDNRGRPEQLKD